jgi:hypothetical protein
MHQNDRRFLSRVFPDVDPMLIPQYESFSVVHHFLRKERAPDVRVHPGSQSCTRDSTADHASRHAALNPRTGGDVGRRHGVRSHDQSNGVRRFANQDRIVVEIDLSR